MATNIELSTQVSSSAFSGTGNVVIGQSISALSATDSNRLAISNNTSTALVLGDFANNNIIAGSNDMTGPRLYGGQDVIFLTTTSTVPATGPTGGIALFTTDGTNLQFMGATGGIQFGSNQLFKTAFPDNATTAGVLVNNNVRTAMTGSSPWQTSSTGFINTTKGTFVNGLYTFGADANNSLWKMWAGLRYDNSVSTSGIRWISIAVNGPPATNFIDCTQHNATTYTMYVNWSGMISANSGDTLSLVAFQNSGKNISVLGNGGSPPTGAWAYGGTFFALSRVK